MPWKEIRPMDQKVKLIADWRLGEYSIVDLSKKHGVSRKAVYKWINRYEEEGVDGLKERSRAPIYRPNTTEEHILASLIEEKLRHRKWGPKKIIAILNQRHPDIRWPAASTAGEWFKKEGLVKERKHRRRVPSYNDPFSECLLPNDVWSVDYKGQFRTQNGTNCYPLTISDNHSRYLLACKALKGPRYKETRRVLEYTFKEYGLPYAIRTDNGIPFAGTNVGGLSRLSIWWIKLGIRPERIEKGKPQQNGRHERMHRTLKEQAVKPQAVNLRAQQEKLDWFRIEYNNDRPHEALGQRPPGSIYERSKHPYLRKPRIPDYDLGVTVRSIRPKGEIKFKNKFYHITKLLHGEQVGLKEIADGKWQINFSFQPIGIINLHRKRVERIENSQKV